MPLFAVSFKKLAVFLFFNLQSITRSLFSSFAYRVTFFGDGKWWRDGDSSGAVVC